MKTHPPPALPAMGLAAVLWLWTGHPARGQDAWTGFKPGSWVTNRSHTRMRAGGNDVDTTVESTYRLLEVTPTEYVLELETESTTKVMGQDLKAPRSKSTVRMPRAPGPVTGEVAAASVSPASVAAPGVVGTAGEEEITVAGKKVKCQWSQAETEIQGTHTRSKTWMSHEVPGLTVRIESRTTGASETEVTQEAVAWEVK